MSSCAVRAVEALVRLAARGPRVGSTEPVTCRAPSLAPNWHGGQQPGVLARKQLHLVPGRAGTTSVVRTPIPTPVKPAVRTASSNRTTSP